MSRAARLRLVLVVPVLLGGCAAQGAASSTSPRTGDVSASPGSAAAAGSPPQTAAMVCGAEIKGKVRRVLSLPSDPATSATWANSLYTCNYTLPMGPMTLTVQVLPSGVQARAKLDRDQAATAGAEPLAGLGERAWGTPAGTAAVLKDNQILTVDTTGLPPVFGANDQKRTDLAFEVASDVLGCWTGDGS